MNLLEWRTMLKVLDDGVGNDASSAEHRPSKHFTWDPFDDLTTWPVDVAISGCVHKHSPI